VKNELRSVNRSLTPWLFVGLHAPWYTSKSKHGEPAEIDMRASMESLFNTHKVDIVFAGHVHAYERVFPVYKEELTDGAPMYINLGDGGNREGLVKKFVEPPPVWSAFRDAMYGHGRFEIVNSTHASWGWHMFNTPDDVASDAIWIVRNSHTRPGFPGVDAHPRS